MPPAGSSKEVVTTPRIRVDTKANLSEGSENRLQSCSSAIGDRKGNGGVCSLIDYAQNLKRTFLYTGGITMVWFRRRIRPRWNLRLQRIQVSSASRSPWLKKVFLKICCCFAASFCRHFRKKAEIAHIFKFSLAGIRKPFTTTANWRPLSSHQTRRFSRTKVVHEVKGQTH